MAPIVWPSGHEYFLHCHGSDILSNLYDWRYKHITTLSIKRAKAVFYSTPDLKSHIDTVRDNSIFIPNPIDTEFFRPPVSHRDNHQLSILVASRLAKKKGIDIALEGIKRARSARNFNIIFRSVGIDKIHYLKRIRNEIPDSTLIPELSKEQLLNLLQRSDIVIGQMSSGALGMTELEAMSCAKPVIANFRYHDSYETAPPIIQAETPDDVSAGIIDMIDDIQSRITIGNMARQWILNNHSLNLIGHRIRKYYDDLM